MKVIYLSEGKICCTNNDDFGIIEKYIIRGDKVIFKNRASHILESKINHNDFIYKIGFSDENDIFLIINDEVAIEMDDSGIPDGEFKKLTITLQPELDPEVEYEFEIFIEFTGGELSSYIPHIMLGHTYHLEEKDLTKNHS